jgi:hypothetical protein
VTQIGSARVHRASKLQTIETDKEKDSIKMPSLPVNTINSSVRKTNTISLENTLNLQANAASNFSFNNHPIDTQKQTIQMVETIKSRTLQRKVSLPELRNEYTFRPEKSVHKPSKSASFLTDVDTSLQ